MNRTFIQLKTFLTDKLAVTSHEQLANDGSKYQIANSKSQINHNDRNSKPQTVSKIEVWILRFVWSLMLGICDFSTLGNT
jgi:hypothetical protein